MEITAAKKLVRETFEKPFDKRRFIDLTRNLVKHLSDAPFIYQGNIIPDAFENSIQSLERIGKYEAQKLDILIVRLEKDTSLERARTMQRNFVAWYLNGSRGGELKDAGLVAFVSPDGKDWRFSLVKMDYQIPESPEGKLRVETELTPARRFSFLVGEQESSHTAQRQLLNILINDRPPTLEDFEKAFGIEVVTKEFFTQYRSLYEDVVDALQSLIQCDARVKDEFNNKKIDPVNFAKKLLGQIVFLYFLQKKGWFGVGRDDNWGTGPRDFFRRLFDKKITGYQNFFNDVLEPLFYEALARDRRDSDDYYQLFNSKIPFLNGGLFDPISDYSWVHIDILLPNELFSNNYQTEEGDNGTGILDVFDRYNFTVKEDEPLEKEVAVDPEMLGKVFENLLEVKDRKSKGTYYTPREIVHYMCQESLINYLDTNLNSGKVALAIEKPVNLKLFGAPAIQQLAMKTDGYTGKIPRDDIESFIHLGEMAIEHDTHVGNIGKETRHYSYKLPESIRWNAKLIDDQLASIRICDPAIGSGAFPVGIMTEIVRARNTLTSYMPEETGRTGYDFKRHAIQECLYGVDIDPGAVEIAKLRLWLSMVVDENDIKSIKPLPNLDYKVVHGNSLQGVKKDILNWPLIEKLEKLKDQFFDETNGTDKKSDKADIDSLFSQLTDNNKTFDFQIYFSEVFREKGGFDIVIANPPYIQLQKDEGKLANQYQIFGYKTFERTGDIYALFYERGIDILQNGGHLCYITSNKWMRAGYGQNLRSYFLTKNPKLLIDLGPGIFENAIVDTNILIIQNLPNNHCMSGLKLTTEAKDTDLADYISQNAIKLSYMTKNPWFIGSDAEQGLKEKIENIGTPLKNWDVHIYRGVLTGLNDAFFINTATKDKLCNEDPKSAEIIKPILRGRDVQRYKYEWAGLYIIATGYDINIPQLYPAVYTHLKQFEEKAKKREDQGANWWNLRACVYYPEFEKEKLVWIDLSDKGRFSKVEPGVYIDKTLFFLTGSNIQYLLGILNSKLINWYLDTICNSSGVGTNLWSKISIESLPIPKVTNNISEKINRLINIVTEIEKINKSVSSDDTKLLEHQIDQLVYQLYGLTEEEIGVVEGENA